MTISNIAVSPASTRATTSSSLNISYEVAISVGLTINPPSRWSQQGNEGYRARQGGNSSAPAQTQMRKPQRARRFTKEFLVLLSFVYLSVLRGECFFPCSTWKSSSAACKNSSPLRDFRTWSYRTSAGGGSCSHP